MVAQTPTYAFIILLLEAELRVIFAALAFVAFATMSARAVPEIKGSPVELGAAPSLKLMRDGCGYAYHRVLWQDGWGDWYWGRCEPDWWGEGAFLPPADEADDD